MRCQVASYSNVEEVVLEMVTGSEHDESFGLVYDREKTRCNHFSPLAGIVSNIRRQKIKSVNSVCALS